MTQLIKNDKPEQDAWIVIAKNSDYPAVDIEAGKQVILPLSLWEEHREKSSSGNVGVWLDSDESADALSDHCDTLPLIAINFPGFADGRGYSLARQLRDKLNFTGDLRAIGDVLKDQMFFYQRSGFTSYLIREDRPADQAAKGLTDFSLVYQPASDERVSVNQKR